MSESGIFNWRGTNLPRATLTDGNGKTFPKTIPIFYVNTKTGLAKKYKQDSKGEYILTPCGKDLEIVEFFIKLPIKLIFENDNAKKATE